MNAIWPLADGVHFAVNGKQRAFGRTFVECIDLRNLDGLSQGCFFSRSWWRRLRGSSCHGSACGRHVIADDILQFVR